MLRFARLRTREVGSRRIGDDVELVNNPAATYARGRKMNATNTTGLGQHEIDCHFQQ